MKFVVILSSLTILTACGSTVSNTDKPTGVYVGGATSVSGDYGIKVASKAPASGGKQVSGISCKNKFWEPAPDDATAISVLKREAKNSGFNSVFITSVEADPNALLKNCWSAIIAKGIAFNG